MAKATVKQKIAKTKSDVKGMSSTKDIFSLMPVSMLRIGKPLAIKTAGELKIAIIDYFIKCRQYFLIPNKAGLCVFLGISRDTYSEYRKRYPDAIKAADSAIEAAWVQRLSGQAAAGAIFYLKNAFKEDYKDRHENDFTFDGKSLGVVMLPIRGAEKNG